MPNINWCLVFFIGMHRNLGFRNLPAESSLSAFGRWSPDIRNGIQYSGCCTLQDTPPPPLSGCSGHWRRKRPCPLIGWSLREWKRRRVWAAATEHGRHCLRLLHYRVQPIIGCAGQRRGVSSTLSSFWLVTAACLSNGRSPGEQCWRCTLSYDRDLHCHLTAGRFSKAGDCVKCINSLHVDLHCNGRMYELMIFFLPQSRTGLWLGPSIIYWWHFLIDIDLGG